MKKTFALVVSLLAIGAVSASAADLPAKVYTKAPVMADPGYSWTGFYAGLNAGGGWTNSGISDPVTSSFCNAAFGGCPGGGLVVGPGYGLGLAQAVPATLSTKSSGFVGGGQFGYNYQLGQAVYGFETDLQWANIKGSANATNTTLARNDGGGPEFLTVAGNGSQKLDTFGTLRGRVGWTPMSSWLLYGTGGLAYGRTASSASFTETPSAIAPFFIQTTSAANSAWRVGWTAGAGAEWMVAQHWSIKAEYLYYDLGSVTVNNTFFIRNGAGTPFYGATIASRANYNGNIIRGGVNYHF